MAENEAHKTGRETRRQVIGETMLERMGQSAYDGPIMSDFVDYATEAVWGLLWSSRRSEWRAKPLLFRTGAWRCRTTRKNRS